MSNRFCGSCSGTLVASLALIVGYVLDSRCRRIMCGVPRHDARLSRTVKDRDKGRRKHRTGHDNVSKHGNDTCSVKVSFAVLNV